MFTFVGIPWPARVCGSRRWAAPLSAPTHPPTLQAKNERNYHIFYELLAGLPAQLRQAFSLQEAETYYYLNQVRASRHLRVSRPGSPLPLHPSGLREPSHGVLMASNDDGSLGGQVGTRGVSSWHGQGFKSRVEEAYLISSFFWTLKQNQAA